MEVGKVLRPIIKIIFLVGAALEVTRERIEDEIDSWTARAGEARSNSSDRMHETRDKFKQMLSEASQNVWQRSEVLENQVREKIRRQVADFSLGALGDSTEINELRAEIATLRAEISELKQKQPA
jgi:polyhydroxyalkanoate synthesis regulator phasin